MNGFWETMGHVLCAVMCVVAPFGLCVGFVMSIAAVVHVIEGDDKWEVAARGKTDNIVSVFMNNPHEYVIVEKSSTSKGTKLVAKTIQGEFELVADVPVDKLIYATWTRTHNLRYSESDRERLSRFTYVIHLHSENDLQGGEWHYRSGGKLPKTTKGKVTKVE